MSSKPEVLLLSLTKDNNIFNEVHAHLLTALRAKATIVEADTMNEAIVAFTSPALHAILITSPEIADKGRFAPLRGALLNLVKGGKSVVFSGLFASFVTFRGADALFGELSLPWQFGSYTNMEQVLNTTPEARFKNTTAFPKKFYAKACHLQNAAPEDAIYVPAEDEDEDEDDEDVIAFPFGLYYIILLRTSLDPYLCPRLPHTTRQPCVPNS